MRTPPLICPMIASTLTSFQVGKLLAALITPPSTAPGQPNPIPAMRAHDAPASRSADSQQSATHAKTAWLMKAHHHDGEADTGLEGEPPHYEDRER
jgi:hypothetical protein